MRKLAITMALASTALATPAVAKDHSVYVGLEGGVMWVEDSPFNVADNRTNPRFTLDHKTGYDIDAIAGYDFGSIRLEAEIGYKHAGIASANSITTGYPASGSATSLSLMSIKSRRSIFLPSRQTPCEISFGLADCALAIFRRSCSPIRPGICSWICCRPRSPSYACRYPASASPPQCRRRPRSGG